MGVLSKILTATAVVIISGVSTFYLIRKRKSRNKPELRKAEDAFNYLDINILTNVEDCDHVVHELRKRSMKHKALGFDCEWITTSHRQPVALLQLSSYDGYCGLFRLNFFPHRTIPNSLKNLLECKDIYKVGVAPNGDANYISNDYQTTVRAAIDIRFLVELSGLHAGGLAAMTESVLNVSLDKRWKTRCSNWEADDLSPLQLHYAASDAHAAILIFVTVLEKYNKRSFNIWNSQDDVWDRTDEICWQFSDKNYKTKHNTNKQKRKEGSKKDIKAKEKKFKRLYAQNAARTKPLYNNCFLQAPDGDVLCTCDTKKALWYIDKGLAALITEEPLTVRLLFEPAARATGDVGEYYRMTKMNHCVVCGATNSYIRKNIVPREYRRFFPEIMKDHSSHDVLLLCVPCHQRSNVQDLVQRRRLAAACAAPLASDPKIYEDAQLKRVKLAARALLYHGRNNPLPADRRKELEAAVRTQYPGQDELTDDMLQRAVNLQHTIANEDFTTASHGYKVVAKYLKSDGGLLKLEEEWRRHFLASMDPKFMPELWSIQHNRDRLKHKWDEKRLDKKDLTAIGVEWS